MLVNQKRRELLKALGVLPLTAAGLSARAATLFDDASSEYLSLSSAILTAVPISVSFWYNTDISTPDQECWSLGNSGSDNEAFGIKLDASSGKVEVFARSGGVSDTAESTAGFNTDTWEQGGAEFASNASRFAVINGVKGTEDTGSRTPTGLDQTALGARFRTTASAFLSGSLAECAMWSSTLTDGEWAALGAGISPLLIRPQSLVMYTPLVGGLNTELIGGIDWTVNGTPTANAHSEVFMPSAQALQFPPAAGGGAGAAVLRRRRATL